MLLDNVIYLILCTLIEITNIVAKKSTNRQKKSTKSRLLEKLKMTALLQSRFSLFIAVCLNSFPSYYLLIIMVILGDIAKFVIQHNIISAQNQQFVTKYRLKWATLWIFCNKVEN